MVVEAARHFRSDAGAGYECRDRIVAERLSRPRGTPVKVAAHHFERLTLFRGITMPR
jgi:hypothetical protein